MRKKRGKTGGEDEWRVKRQIECMFFNLAVVLCNFFCQKTANFIQKFKYCSSHPT